MRSKILAGTSALAFTAAAILATAGPASAQHWHGHRGVGVAGLAAGVVGGALAAATAPLWAPGYYYNGYPDYAYAPGYAYDDTYSYAPGYAYSPGYAYDQGSAYDQGYAVGGRNDAYCAQRYRSYDPASGTFLGYDGVRHPCP